MEHMQRMTKDLEIKSSSLMIYFIGDLFFSAVAIIPNRLHDVIAALVIRTLAHERFQGQKQARNLSDLFLKDTL